MHPKCRKYLDAHIAPQEGKRFLITGASSGIGLECAKALLYKGAEVTFMVRNKEKTEAVIQAIEDEFGHPVHAKIALYDQAKPDSIRSSIASLPEEGYDAIVLNAGIYIPRKGSLGEEGNPLTLQVNAIGTQLCLDCFLSRYPKARYIVIDSIVNSSPRHHDYAPYFHRGFDKRMKDYSLSKRICMNVFYNALLDGIDIHMTHPGIARTNIIQSFAPLIKRLGNGFLYLFSHPSWKAALGMSLLCTGRYEKGSYLVPRGPFEISGYPKKRSIPKRAKKDAASWRNFWHNDCPLTSI